VEAAPIRRAPPVSSIAAIPALARLEVLEVIPLDHEPPFQLRLAMDAVDRIVALIDGGFGARTMNEKTLGTGPTPDVNDPDRLRAAREQPRALNGADHIFTVRLKPDTTYGQCT
jgi:hypothetical protein